MGFREEDLQRQRERGMGGEKIGGADLSEKGTKPPLSPLQTHLSPPSVFPSSPSGEIFVFITAGLLQGLEILPTCLFLYAGSHLSGCN